MPQSQNPLITLPPTLRVFIRPGKCQICEARGGWMARLLGMRPTPPRTTASWWWLRSRPSFIDPSSPVWDSRQIRCSLIFSNGDEEKWSQQKAQVANRFAAESRLHWVEVFSELDACVSPVLTYAESAEQAHLAVRGANRRIGDQVFPAPAPRFSQTPSSAPRSELTTDPAAYLSSIGVSQASLDAWRQSLLA